MSSPDENERAIPELVQERARETREVAARAVVKCQAVSTSASHYPTLCIGMRAALACVPDNHDGKGLSFTRGWLDGDSGRPRYLGVIYKRTARDAGTVLNICPWCGASVRFDEMTSSAGSTAAPNVGPK